jgi:O-6-methylguanine DNA methyltransferase
MTKTKTNAIYYYRWRSSVGPVHLVATDRALRTVAFDTNWGRLQPRLATSIVEGANTIIDQTITELTEYLGRRRRDFSVPLEPIGTEFQMSAWRCLRTIPYGQIWSYADQAKRLKNPKAARAVGAANGQNPIGILIPCHRVLGGSGELVGYAGGLENKRRLLEIEGSFFTAGSVPGA